MNHEPHLDWPAVASRVELNVDVRGVARWRSDQGPKYSYEIVVWLDLRPFICRCPCKHNGAGWPNRPGSEALPSWAITGCAASGRHWQRSSTLGSQGGRSQNVV
jgi:hypothetical protein